ncbi:MAG: BON domain-containing protein [Rhodopirellula sp. JB053]|uniref:BON domain-containing protein n=1 Tax=Rhodopirellula sp. JB044 TaxID=3342844 RepID=UPI00370CE9DC
MFTMIESPPQLATPPLAKPRPTDAVVEQLHRALAESKRCGLRGARCRFEAGVATLHGTVDSFYLKQLAQEIIRRVPAVKAIRNHLRVTAI